MGLLFLPYAIIALVFWRYLWGSFGKQKASLLLMLAYILFTGALAYVFFHPQKDATQLYYNLAIPLLNCSAILICIRIFQFRLQQPSRSSLQQGMAILLIGILLLFSYRQGAGLYKRNIAKRNVNYFSQEYLLDIQAYIQGGSASKLGAAIKGQGDFGSPFSKLTAAYSLGYYLGYMENGYVAVGISDLDIPTANASQARDVASGSFYQFVQRQKADSRFVSVENSQMAFIRQHEITYVIVSRHAKVPDSLMSQVKTIYTDSRSKERFLVLE